MIIAILIITCLSVLMNFFLLMVIGRNQEGNYRSLYKHHMWDEITQIRRTVKGINEKVEQIRRLSLPKK
jgi:hypothetical protein